MIVDWANAVSGSRIADVARSYYLLGEGLAPGEKDIPAQQKLFRRLLALTYLRKYLRYSPVNKKDFNAWKAIIAAARLSENIPEEKNKLLKIVRFGIRDFC